MNIISPRLINFSFRTCFMFRTIPAMKIKPWIILKPFAADTWYMIIVIVVIIVLILSFILKLEHASDYGYSISALIAVASLCQQGTYDCTIQQQKYCTLVIHYIAIRFPFSHRQISQSNRVDSDHGFRPVGVQLLFGGDSVSQIKRASPQDE